MEAHRGRSYGRSEPGNAAASQRLRTRAQRPDTRQEAPELAVGPAVEFGSPADPLHVDPRTYKNYMLVHLLMMGEKVADLADPGARRRASRNGAATRATHPGARRAGPTPTTESASP